ncbi:MAG: lamin tail domain-containing protein, partial [Candidatus Latescibacterota bacterium]
MRWFSLCLSFLVCSSFLSDRVLINELYYDHPGRDDGHEFVEIINLSPAALGLGGCRLEFHDGSSVGWVTIWHAQPGDTIVGMGLFVVGGEDLYPPPDVITELGLQNGPDAVRLVDGGVVLDLLGYGALESPGYFEGRSAPDVPQGSSLSR